MFANGEVKAERGFSLSASGCTEDLLKTEIFTDNFLSFEDVGKYENSTDNDLLNFDCSDEVNKFNVIMIGLERINSNTDFIITYLAFVVAFLTF